MQASREFRDRPETEVAVLDALVDRQEEGMTVLELRAHVDDADIDAIEEALTALKADDLIDATQSDGRTVIRPDDAVVPDGPQDDEPSFIDQLLDRFTL
ncbi:MAG: DUF6432 family protein [Halobacteriaceae archaeon]